MKTEVVLGDMSGGSCVWHGSWESGWSQICDSLGSLLSVCCVPFAASNIAVPQFPPL